MTLIEVPAWRLKRYAAHQKKECVFIVFALERFHQYTFGRRTTVHSEHKSLEMIVQKTYTKPQGDCNERSFVCCSTTLMYIARGKKCTLRIHYKRSYHNGSTDNFVAVNAVTSTDQHRTHEDAQYLHGRG